MVRRWLLPWGVAAVVVGLAIADRSVPEAPVFRPLEGAALASDPGVQRAFAKAFCDEFAGDAARFPGTGCRDWMWWPHAGEAVASPPAATEARPATRTLVIIPGMFGECVAPWVGPYSSQYADLEARGYRVAVVPVEGRGSSARNAEILHRFLTRPGLDLHDAVVIAYSKGLTDFMLAATQPQAAAWRDQVDVLVSVAGTARGSRMADRFEPFHARWLAGLALDDCGASDRGGVRSLGAAEALPIATAYERARLPFRSYSVVASAPMGTLNPWLAGFNRLLSAIDERNDGQMLAIDAVAPGSTVLGVFRADHWSIALPFEDSDAWRMQLFAQSNRFPRGALVRAVLGFAAPVAARPEPQAESVRP